MDATHAISAPDTCVVVVAFQPRRMRLLARVATVSGWTFVSRILGLVRDRILAGAFGGSLLLDAFFIAFAVPNLLRNLFGEGALSAAFIPRYVQLRDRDPALAEAFAGQVLARLSLGLGLLAAWIMGLLLCLHAVLGGDAAVVAWLALPQTPYLIFICVSAICAGILNGRRHFAIPAMAPVILNVVLITTVIVVPQVELLPLAVLIAGLLQLAAHLIGLVRNGGIPGLVWQRGEEYKDLRRALVPVLIATSVHQLNALLDSILAFWLVAGSGAVAYLYFANRLLQFPMALVGHGVSTAIYPELASAAREGWAATGQALRHGGAILAGLLLPAAVGLWVVAEPLVATIYQVGQFDDEAVARTVLVTQMLALALVPISLSKLFVRACHANRDQRSPLVIGLATVGINLVANIILVQTPLREAGLALGTALSGLVSCLAFGWLLMRRGTGLPVPVVAIVVPGLGALAMAGAVSLVRHWWPTEGVFAAAGIELIASVAIGMGVYAAIAGPVVRQRWASRRRQADTHERP